MSSVSTNCMHNCFAKVRDNSTSTKADKILSEVCNNLPAYMTSLKHFYSVFGVALWLCFSSHNSRNPESKHKWNESFDFPCLLRICQENYNKDDKISEIRLSHSRGVCQHCGFRDEENKERTSDIACQTEPDISWEVDEQHLIWDIKTHVDKCNRGETKASRTSSIPNQSSTRRSHVPQPSQRANQDEEEYEDEGGPEEPPEEEGAVGGVAQVPARLTRPMGVSDTEAISDSDSASDDIAPPRRVPPRGGLLGGARDAEPLSDSDSSSNDIEPPRRVPPSGGLLGGPRDTEEDGVIDGRDAEEGKCKLCHINDMDVVLLPCGHFATCSDCTALATRCPVATCDEVIQASLRAYRA